MSDKVEKINTATIQHGKENDRVYVMKIGNEPVNSLIKHIETLSEENSYTKIFCKVPEKYAEHFAQHHFHKEAYIPEFYNGRETLIFMSKFLDKNRKLLTAKEKKSINEIITLAKAKKDSGIPVTQPDFDFRILHPKDIPSLIKVYKTVFVSYPFPIFRDDYLLQTMKKNIIYFGAFTSHKLVSASSAEMDISSSTVEMTDFATLPDYRGNSLAVFLLDLMEKEMIKRDICTSYTIARALSPGMNITFAKFNYTFSGTLIHNTNIAGSIENMNIWFKKLV